MVYGYYGHGSWFLAKLLGSALMLGVTILVWQRVLKNHREAHKKR